MNRRNEKSGEFDNEQSNDLFRQLSDDPLFLKQIADSGPAITYVLDLERCDFIYIHISANDLSGNDKSYFFMQGKNIFTELVHPWDYERAMQYVYLLSKEDKDLDVLEARLKIKDNTYRWFRFNDHIFKRDQQGRPLRSIGVALDIHETKLATQESAKLNNWFNSVLENSPNGITALKAIRDKRGAVVELEYIFANRIAVRAINKGELNGTLFCKDLPSLKESNLFEHYVEVIETGISWAGEVLFKDDHLNVDSWLLVSVSKLDDGCIACFFDLTERKKIEQQILRQERQYHSLVENTPDVISRWNQDLRLIYANSAAETRTGVPRESLYGKTGSEMGHPDDLAFPWTEKLRSVFETGQQTTAYQVVPTPHGSHHFFALMVPERNDEGEVETVLAIARDITELKKAEEELITLKDELARKVTDKYQALFDSIDEGFCIIEKIEGHQQLDFRFVEVNPAFGVHIGVADIVGKTIREAFPQESEEWYTIYNSIVETGRDVRFERAMDSQEKVLELYAFRIKDETARRVAVVFRDITERKKAEQQALRYKDILAQKATDKYLSIFNAIDEGFHLVEVIFDDNDRNNKVIDLAILEENPSAQRIFGESFVGKTIRQTHPEYDPSRMQVWGEVVRTGQRTRLERYSDIWKKWFDFHLTKVGDENSNMVAAIFQDITERKRAEEVLRKSEENLAADFAEAGERLKENNELLQSIMDSSLSIIRVIGAIRDAHNEIIDFRYILANKKAHKNYDVDERKGKLFSEVHPELMKSELFSNFKMVVETGNRANFEICFDKEVSCVWFNVIAVKLRDGIVFSLEDITERKRRELNSAFLSDIQDDLANLHDEDQILQIVGSKIGRFMEVSTAVLVDVDEVLDEVRPHDLWRTEGMPKLPLVLRLSAFGGEESQAMLRAGQTVVIHDTEAGSLVYAAAHRPIRVRSSINVPFHRGGKWKYLISVTDSKPRQWRDDEVDLFKEVAHRISLRIERARADEALRRSEEKYRIHYEQRMS